MSGAQLRLERLFSRGENAVIVAMDHGEFDGPIAGMEDLVQTAAKVDPCVDGILLSPAMLRLCRHAFNYKGAPMPIVRLNWSTVYCFHWRYDGGPTVGAFSPREAAALGAEVALVSLTLRSGSEQQDANNVELFRRLCAEAHELGLPVVGEYFPINSRQSPGDEMADEIRIACRILAELGADLIKTFYTSKFRRTVEGCPIPVLGLGAERKPTQLEALQLAARQIQDGARGVVFGRNALQVLDPPAFQRALCDVVKRKADPAEAMKHHGLKEQAR